MTAQDEGIRETRRAEARMGRGREIGEGIDRGRGVGAGHGFVFTPRSPLEMYHATIGSRVLNTWPAAVIGRQSSQFGDGRASTRSLLQTSSSTPTSTL
jgi:hypothetical protein